MVILLCSWKKKVFLKMRQKKRHYMPWCNCFLLLIFPVLAAGIADPAGLSLSHTWLASQRLTRQKAFCSLIKIPFCYILSFPIFHVEGCLLWLNRCINDIGARAFIMDGEAISAVDQSFLLKNTDHAILRLSLRYGSYLMVEENYQWRLHK